MHTISGNIVTCGPDVKKNIEAKVNRFVDLYYAGAWSALWQVAKLGQIQRNAYIT